MMRNETSEQPHVVLLIDNQQRRLLQPPQVASLHLTLFPLAILVLLSLLTPSPLI